MQKCPCSVVSVIDIDKLGQSLAMLLRSLRTNEKESIFAVIYTKMDRQLGSSGLMKM